MFVVSYGGSSSAAVLRNRSKSPLLHLPCALRRCWFFFESGSRAKVPKCGGETSGFVSDSQRVTKG